MKQLVPAFCGFLLALTLGSALAADHPASLPLWSGGAPGSEARSTEPEKIEAPNPGVCNVTNVHQPSLTPYLPAPEKATGAAILIAPGGGHQKLCLGHEGYSLGAWLAEHGIAAFVLKYRLAREPGSSYTVDDHAMADTRRALRLIRQRAGEWKIQPTRIGVMGFSAGGELAALAAMQSDAGHPGATDPIERQSCRPDFQVLIYPGSSKRFTVAAGMPPAFMACGADDRPDISEGMASLYLKYKEAKVPAELHIYAKTGHGFGYRPDNTSPAGAWPERLVEWLEHLGFLS
jgi:acetyl esterase/lipase